MIRVLVDATGLTRNKAGVGVYGVNLLEGLAAAAGSEMHFFVVVQDDDPDLARLGSPHVTLLPMPSRLLRKVPLRLLFEQFVLPLMLLFQRIDVVHSLHYFFPLFRFRTKSAVTIHDMTSFSMPEMHIGVKGRFFRFFVRRSRRHCDALIFVSRSAQQDFLSRFGSPRGFTRVIHHGKSSGFQPVHDAATVASVRARYGLPAQYILYVGTIEPRKNLERLLRAFALLSPRHPGVNLVLAGMMGWKQEHLLGLVQSLGLADRVCFPGFVAEEHKASLIGGCALFAYPSLYEGFGLPVLEALASGVPTVTSDRSSLPEVAGDAAVLVDPEDTGALAAAMDAILSDPGLAAELRRKGPEQAAQFTWERTAEQTVAVYRCLANDPAQITPNPAAHES